MKRGVYLRRKAVNGLAMTFAVVMTASGLFWLAWILWTVIKKGAGYVTLTIFTMPTPAPGDMGGLGNAILGSLLLVGMGVAVGAPIGILAGTWLAEFSNNSRPAKIIRFVNDVLLSAPSILIGVFIYQVCVVPSGHFSAWAGGLAMAVIAVSIIVRTTEDMLNMAPNELREAATALGAPRWKVTLMVVYRSVYSGLLTGIMLAIARISGETAPLLFTTLNNQFWSFSLNRPMANLPVTIFQFAMSPYKSWQNLAWAGAFLITAGVLILNITARIFLKGNKHAE